MSIWVILGWEESYGNWEVLSVLFDAAAVETKVKEIFTEYMHYPQVKVECWHKDNMDDPDASYYETEYFYREDE